MAFISHHPPAHYREGTATLQMHESTSANDGRWKSLTHCSYFEVQCNLQLCLAATAQLSLYDNRRSGPKPPHQSCPSLSYPLTVQLLVVCASFL